MAEERGGFNQGQHRGSPSPVVHRIIATSFSIITRGSREGSHTHLYKARVHTPLSTFDKSKSLSFAQYFNSISYLDDTGFIKDLKLWM